MAKTEPARNLPQRRAKKVPAQLNATIDESVATKFNAFVAWLNLSKGEVSQMAVENLMNEDAYAEFRNGYADGTIKAPATESGKSSKGNKARVVAA